MTIMPAKPRAARTVLGSVEVNGGRDRGELVREADPETGLTVEHVIVLTTTYVDRLYADGHLSRDAREGADMRDAAAKLRADWIEADVQVGAIRGLEQMHGGRTRDPIGDEDAYRRYAEALESLTKFDANVARRAIIDEQPVMLEPLRSALSGLARHYTQRRGRR